MANITTELSKETRQYNPSWFDRITNWVEKLPVRAWIFYIVLGVALILVQLLFLWLDSGLKAMELLPVLIFNGLFTPFLLALIHFFDKQAVTALNSLRPVLDMSDPEIDQFEYRLSTMPFLAPLIIGLAMMAFMIFIERVSIEPTRYAALEQLPTFAVVFHIIDKSFAFLFGVVIFHTIRQLRLVNYISSNYIIINLFHLRPLQAFSRLTASTAVVFVVGLYGWILINPELLTDPVDLGFVVTSTILAVVVFVWPLAGIHRLMEKEKQRMLDGIDLKFEAVYAMFNQIFHDGDHTEIKRLNETISSLDIQQKKIMAFHTWPWSSETARYVLTAIALPLVLSILQFLFEQVIGG